MLALLPLALAVLQPAQDATAAPVWTIREATDATTGKRSATAAIRSADGKARLIVRCDTAATPIISIQYIPTPRFAASDSRQVTLMFDDAKTDISVWEFPGSGAYYAEQVSVFLIVQQLAAAKRIHLTVDNPEGAAVESDFVGPGGDAMFRQVYAACGFPYEMPPVPVNS